MYYMLYVKTENYECEEPLQSYEELTKHIRHHIKYAKKWGYPISYWVVVNGEHDFC